MSTAVRPGYKLTEVGVIPEDWETVLLDSVAQRGSGHTPDKKHPEYWNGRVHWISLADSDSLDKLYISDTKSRITPLGLAHSSAVMHPAGTVVMTRDAGIGKSAIMSASMAVSQHFMAWRCGPRLDNEYLYYWLQIRKPEFERIGNGNTIKTIGLGYFRELIIPLPSLSEQRNIAFALSDIDGHLKSLDRLLAKKRDLKQAVMQELLAGKTRLPGFGGEWEQALLGVIAAIRNVKVIAKAAEPGTRCVELECMSSNGTGRLLMSPDAAGHSLKYTFKKGDVLFGRLRAYLRKFWLAEFEGCCSTEIWPLMARDSRLSSGFLHILVQTTEFGTAASVAYGTHMPRSDWSTLAKISVPLPPVAEQIAIASVLSDMDAEISAIERRRDKTKLLKQAMMQELLTGKTRLV